MQELFKKHCKTKSHTQSTAIQLLHNSFPFPTFGMSGSSISFLSVLALHTLLLLSLFLAPHGATAQRLFLTHDKLPLWTLSEQETRNSFTFWQYPTWLPLLFYPTPPAHKKIHSATVDGPSHPERVSQLPFLPMTQIVILLLLQLFLFGSLVPAPPDNWLFAPAHQDLFRSLSSRILSEPSLQTVDQADLKQNSWLTFLQKENANFTGTLVCVPGDGRGPPTELVKRN